MKKLRILLITQGNSRAVQPIFSSGHEVVGVLESMPRNFSKFNKPNLLLKFLKSVRGIFYQNKTSLKKFCENNCTPYNFIWKGNLKDIIPWVEDKKPDLIVVYTMSQLLKEDVLSIPSLGAINLHPSYLPSYRGPNPDFWQYYEMEMNPGATVHYIDAGEDTGDIIFQEKTYIPLGTKSPERLNKLIGEVGVPLLLKAIDAIAAGSVHRIVQPVQSQTLRARNLKDEEHAEIIDWENWSIERIWHLMRGTELWLNAVPMPSGFFSGQRWSIQEYERTELPQGSFGELGKYKKRQCVFTRDGVIFIKIDFKIQKLILNILK